ncbi:hypothetical protein G5B88_10705 [Herbaspirillum seropedicae]|uniref:Transmembrane protein n=1 Tax=Herbaspirillum seropedicae (strain SmR1) TaxID=757424 RepID=D8IT63_HERSS|nr:hypothetical protein [Herbaspirillum seropedicae]ADJ63622.1 transmembrane protein [Herbaspirillum seropedicae SmR1]AKN65647.1 membrane protein [Herbaspirillum seropedicae]NQE28806.1 membrane protein [Herbaspirillum seropedicae]UMU21611.1 hypothetical protein G5B88_10705 [Herbaspirillum seropedicae]
MSSPSPAPRRPRYWRRRLLAPLIYTAALLLMLEEWLWDASQAVLARIPAWPLLVRLQRWVERLSPYAALLIFLAPTLLLLPVKILALLSITHGHPTLGLCIVLIAKVLGTALVARIYALTRRSLLSLAWFQRYHDKLMEIKARLLAQLHASAGWRQLQRLRQSLREGMLRLRLRLAATPSSPLARILRLVRRLVARMRRR